MEDIEHKYSSLCFEFSKLRTRFQCLREYYINLKKRNKINSEYICELTRKTKQYESEINSLEFRNDQFVSRINFLQEEIRTGGRSHKRNSSKSSYSLDVHHLIPNEETVDFFIETTKVQLANEMIKNDKLSHQIIQLNLQLKSINDEKNKIIETVSNENKILRQKLNKRFNFDEHVDNSLSYGNFIPITLPRKILDNLDSNVYQSLINVYKAFKPLISKLLTLLSKEIHCDFGAFNLVKNGYNQVLMWKDLAPIIRNRILDFSTLIKPLIESHEIISGFIRLLLTKHNTESDMNVVFLYTCDCLYDVHTFLLSLNNLDENQNVSERILSAFKYLSQKISYYSKLVKNYQTRKYFESKTINELAALIDDSAPKMADGLAMIKVFIDSEMNTVSSHGWFPTYFNTKIKDRKKGDDKIASKFYTFQNSLARSSMSSVSRAKSIDSCLNVESQKTNVVLQSQLDECKKQIKALVKEKETLMFNLKAKEILSQHSIDSHNSKLVNEMLAYLETRMNNYLEDNQKLSGNLSLLNSDLKSASSRLNSSEQENYKLKQEISKLKVNLTTVNNELTASRKKYENRLIELTEEVLHLRTNKN